MIANAVGRHSGRSITTPSRSTDRTFDFYRAACNADAV